jgi:hypothetical protein
MEATATATANPNTLNFASSFRFGYDVSLRNFTSLRLKTHEGDVVTLSRSQSLSYSASGEQSRFGDGGDIQDISASGQAAAEYAMSIQGDLNDEEKAAIDELTAKIDPIAQNFFDDVAANPDELDLALKSSLGAIDEIEVSFEQTATLNFSAAQFRQVDDENEQTTGADNLETETVDPERPVAAAPAPPAGDVAADSGESPAIRDVTALVKAVVDAVLHPREIKIPPRDERILQSFDDLRRLLNSKLREFFSPLSMKLELPPDQVGKPAESSGDAAPAETAPPQPEPQPAPPPRLQPVTA